MTAVERYREGIVHSGQILEAAGYDLVPLREPIGKCWDLLGMSPRGPILVTSRPARLLSSLPSQGQG